MVSKSPRLWYSVRATQNEITQEACAIMFIGILLIKVKNKQMPSLRELINDGIFIKGNIILPWKQMKQFIHNKNKSMKQW